MDIINDLFKVNTRFHKLSHDQALDIAYDESVSTSRRIEKYIIIKSDYMNDFWFTETNDQISRELNIHIKSVEYAIAKLIKDRIIAREIHPKDKRIRILLWMDSVHYQLTRRPLKSQVEYPKNPRYSTLKIPGALTNSIRSKDRYNSPIIPSEPPTHPNPPRGRAYDGFSLEEVFEVVFENMGLTESEYNERKRAGILTKEQLQIERLTLNERVMFEGRVRKFPKHLRRIKNERDNLRRKRKT